MSDFQLGRTALSRGSRNASDALADAQRPTLRTSINPPNTVLGIMEAIRYAIRDDASVERYDLD